MILTALRVCEDRKKETKKNRDFILKGIVCCVPVIEEEFLVLLLLLLILLLPLCSYWKVNHPPQGIETPKAGDTS